MVSVQREDGEMKACDVLSLRSTPDAEPQSFSGKYRVPAIFLILPFAWPLVLYFYRPERDFWELMAVIGWPILLFIAGIIISSFSQPKVKDKKIGEDFFKLKLKAHNLRVGWLLFLTVFEAMSAICILARGEGMPIAFYLIPTGLYAVYAVLCIWWLSCLKQLRQKG
jgi:hypothetical protein